MRKVSRMGISPGKEGSGLSSVKKCFRRKKISRHLRVLPSLVLTSLCLIFLIFSTTGEVKAQVSPLPENSKAEHPARQGEETEAASQTGESLKGKISLDGEPIPGARITVTNEAGFFATIETGTDGSWEIPLPAPDKYHIVLDTDSLPSDIFLTSKAKSEFDIPITTEQHRFIAFPLQFGTNTSSANNDSVTLGEIADRSVDGLRFGLIIALSCMGLSLIYGITGLVNFAQGELVTFGALVAFWLNTTGPQIPLIPAALGAVLASGVLGWNLERGIFAPLRRRKTNTVALMVVSIGLSLFLRKLFLVIHGNDPKPYTDYALQQAVEFGPISQTPRGFWIIGICLAVLGAVALFLQHTRTGTAMRAVADNRELAEASGVNVPGILVFTWVLGTALAGGGGVLLALGERVEPDLGFHILLLMFAAVIVGGLGTAYGPVLGGILLGVIVQISTLWFDVEYKYVFALGALVLTLLIRPQGILGRRERVG